MIESRPKRNTVFSLTVFTVISGFGSLYFMRQVLAEPDGTWRYVALGFLLIATSILIYKLLFNYKIIKISHDIVHVYFPFRLYRSSTPVTEIGAWQETIVNTNKTEFKQLKVVFNNKGYIKLSNQENSNYDKVYKYVKKKATKKEVKE